MWLKVDHRSHPHFGGRGALEIEEDIFRSCIEKGVLVARGSWFRTEPGAAAEEEGELFFRATFAAASAKNMNEAIRRFGAAVRESFELNG